MSFDPVTAIGIVASAIPAMGGLYASWRHIRFSIQAKKDRERKSILDEAREAMDKVETKFSDKITKLEIELEAQKLNISRDLSHFKEMHTAEVRVLGEKIENLRENLTQQHQALLELLTKLVGSK